ncbi:hypothetical protein N431DRAFT_428576 [Stipitochalara longipes BDJ]|nr:hypothetical protein N431DRAFT_428576 [Stipitochalara longipes BDJ]
MGPSSHPHLSQCSVAEISIFLLFCAALSILLIQAPMPSRTVSDRLHERFRF